MKVLELKMLAIAFAFIFASCQKTEEAVVNEETSAVEMAESTSDNEKSHDPNFFQGTKIFCEFLNFWEYEVTIKGDDVTIKMLPGYDNDFQPDKLTAKEFYKGKITNGRIVVDLPEDCDYCGPELAENMFKYENGVFSVLYEENNYNDFKECKVPSSWPLPDNESIKVPISDQQWRFCSRTEGKPDYIITFVNGLRTTGMLYFEEVTPTDDNMNNVTGVFTAEYEAGGKITVKKPVNCADCSEYYMNSKFKFNESSMQLVVKDENGNSSILDECMLSQ